MWNVFISFEFIIDTWGRKTYSFDELLSSESCHIYVYITVKAGQERYIISVTYVL